MSQAGLSPTSSRPNRRLRRAGVALGLATCASLLAGSAVVSVVAPSTADAQGVVGLQRGTSGPAVREVQVALMNHGIAIDGGADGVYGAVTEQAVAAFQKRNMLSQTGAVDETTARALGLDTGAAASSSGFVGLSRGMKGADVRLLQHTLIRSGWSLTVGPDGTPDGVFGAETEAAVRDVQRVNGLDATGIVDEATAAALGVTETWGADGELTQGASGDKVLEVQEAIIRDGGFLFGGADGYYGPGTTSAVKKYQLVNDLPVTGVVDEATANIMGIDLSGSSSTTASTTENGGSGGGSSSGGSQASDSGDSNTDDAIQYTKATEIVGLQVGHKGKPVRQLQQALSGHGYTLRGGIDGLYGPETQAAIEHFQSSQGLSATGTVDEATAAALGLTGGSSGDSSSNTSNGNGSDNGSSSGSGNGSSNASGNGSSDDGGSTPAPSYSHPYGGLQRGSTGDKVRHVQEALMATGLVLLGGADGQFGAATESAVKSFQKVNALETTGIVDDATAELLDPAAYSSGSDDGSGGSSGVSNPGNSADVSIDVFPVASPCWFTDTWHAPRGGGRLHLGVDIIADKGTTIYAATDGRITRRYWDQPGSLAGNGLRLTRGDGTYFFYAHLDSFAPGIKEGTKVQAGDVLGTVGNTGNSATSHLHFEVHPKGGEAVDPTPIVQRAGGC